MEYINVGDFDLSDTSMYVNMYEHGYGYQNVPDQDTFSCKLVKSNVDFYIPSSLPASPYIGYGWFLRKLNTINVDEKVDLDHLMTKLNLDDLKKDNIFVIFSRRLAARGMQCDPPKPVYIGYCKTA